MKKYICKYCINKGDMFSGTRRMVRSHLRKEHGIRGKFKMNNEIQPSQLTMGTMVEEVK